MQQTYHTRLNQLVDSPISAADLGWLDAYAQWYGKCERDLYAAIAAGVNPMTAKSRLCQEYDLTSRQYNALRISLKGKIDAVTELLNIERTAVQNSIRSLTASLRRLEKKDADIKRDTLRLSKLKYAKHQLSKHNKRRRLERARTRLAKITQRLKSTVPGICFGSRKLFRQQFHLEQTSFASHAEWKAAWQDARCRQVFSLGSKDETAGNQSCVAAVEANGTISLKLRMPPGLVKQGAPTQLRLAQLAFPYGHERLLAALLNDVPQAVSYRFVRDDESWRVFVSIDVPDEKITSIPAAYGVIGVDFNEHHLAWTETDRFGNLCRSGRIALHLKHKTTDQRAAVLSEALKELLQRATATNKGVVIEDLDFQKKKAQLTSFGDARYARMLSGLAVASYKALIRAKASRAGVRLTIVDPAYTSVAGRVKYAVRHGRTVHQAAAGVIARRGQGYSERPPRSGAHRVPLAGVSAVLMLPVRNRNESTRTSWGSISKKLARLWADTSRTHVKVTPTPKPLVVAKSVAVWCVNK